MKKEQLTLGKLVQLGPYQGVVIEVNETSIIVEFKTWTDIDPWTGKLPKIVFTHYELLDEVIDDE